MIKRNKELAVQLYRRWSQNILIPKVVIIFDSMYGSTEKLARAIMEGL